jgi:VCBS repeat protein
MKRSLRLVLSLCVITLATATLFAGVAFASNPIPQVVGPPVPQALVPGRGAFTLKVYGANFVQGAVVNWNRQPRKTTFVSARELHARILASDVATPTAGYITVTNPPPGGGVSSSSYAIVEVHTPTTTIVAKRPNIYFRGNGAFVVSLGDFNNDGILDFAAEHANEILAMSGNGDGSFRFGSVATGNYCCSIGAAAFGVGDFNNDGNQDLVFGADRNGPPAQLQVNFGEGNGKFRFGARSSFYFDSYPWALTVGDFNRDGNLDVASVEGPYNFYVFLGQGDGNLKYRGGYRNLGKNSPFNVVTADLNGDGILDAVVLADGAYILLGNGDGTFQKPRLLVRNLRAGSGGQSLWVNDFNGDGLVDLAYSERDTSSGKIWVFLGNGDGTFKKPVSLTVPATQGLFSFAVGDFNSDGNTDLMANYFKGNGFKQTETDLFLGNGDGTFQPKKIITLPGNTVYNAEEGIVPADFNSDGLLDFIFQQPGEVDVFTQKQQ